MGKKVKSDDAFLSLNKEDDGKTKSAIKRKANSIRKRNNEKALAASRGLIYVGHIPHGFYEEEMKDYFSQFGRVTNVKVCRSRISGKSKGYGFIEFSTPEVAKIAGETMNNYLMFKKRVVAQFIPYEKRPPFLFKKLLTKKVMIGKFRQERHVKTKNKRIDDDAVVRKKNITILNLKKKLDRLKKRGIESIFTL